MDNTEVMMNGWEAKKISGLQKLQRKISTNLKTFVIWDMKTVMMEDAKNMSWAGLS